MKLIPVICVAILGAGALVGCGSRAEPSPGVVVQRDYDAVHTSTTGTGKNRRTTITPANWDITIRQDADGKEIEYDVSQSIYDGCRINTRWPDCKPK